MTQNNKEILLQDIAGRIPYRPLMFIQSSSSDDYKARFNVRLDVSVYSSIANDKCEAIPYLFPMSHLTEEQCREIEFLAFSKRYSKIDEYTKLISFSTHIYRHSINRLNYNHDVVNLTQPS